jgi:hypothetical protein
MRVISAQAGEGGRCTVHPHFTISTITYNVVVYAPAERADTFPLLLLYPYMYSVGEYLLCLKSLNSLSFKPATAWG